MEYRSSIYMIEKAHSDDVNTILRYSTLLKKYGDCFRALNWGTAESQRARFEVLFDIGIQSGDRILDVGCGLADFYAWLLERLPSVNYEGIDITPNMVQAAKKRFPDIIISNKNIFDPDLKANSFDYLIASGIFFLRKEVPMKYMESIVSEMFDKSIKGIAFNSLSAWASEKTQGEFYADPYEVVEFCKKLSPNIVLRHEYHPADFTVYVYKR